jgi:hypothetical protein
MDPTGADRRPSLLRRYLLKTVFRIAFWVALALAITWVWPGATWAWYVVGAFVGISIAWATFLAVLGIGASQHAREAAEPPADPDEPEH